MSAVVEIVECPFAFETVFRSKQRQAPLCPGSFLRAISGALVDVNRVAGGRKPPSAALIRTFNTVGATLMRPRCGVCGPNVGHLLSERRKTHIVWGALSRPQRD
jgi:hypothetical protein